MNGNRIAVDLDDTVLGYWDRLTAVYNLEEGTNYTEAETMDIIGGATGEWESWMKDHLWLWSTCQALPGALGGLRKLRESGLYVQLLTVTPDWGRDVKWKWLARWRPQVDEVTFVPWGGRKSDYSDAAILIDDRPSSCDDWCKAGDRDTGVGYTNHYRNAIWLPRPWTDAVETKFGRAPEPTHNSVFRADNWQDAVNLVRAGTGLPQWTGGFA